MTILQVNVRPAARTLAFPRSQRRENGTLLMAQPNNHPILQEKANMMAPLTNPNLSATPRHLFPQPKINGNGGKPDDTVINGNGTNGRSTNENSTPAILHQQITWSLTPETPVGRALVSASQRLNGAGCENPRLDAQILLAHVLEADRTWLFAHHDHPLTVDQAEAFTDLVARRIRREPVAYMLGRKEFYGLDFVVDKRVLIPRPETEMLVDFLLAHVKEEREQPIVIADVGTGSGAIAVTTATLAPSNSRIYGLDISPDALVVAQENGKRLAPHASLTFMVSDLLAALPEPVDVIVANLPYVTDGEYTDLAPEIRKYEPQLALTAGHQGLDSIQRLLAQVGDHLKPGGIVILEIGHQQGPAVQQLAEEMQPTPYFVGLRQDYSGHTRMVTIEF